MIYEPFSIVVVPFPFTDKGQAKKRPAVVLSHRKYQSEVLHVSLLMITSAKNSAWSNDYPLASLAETGLSAASIVRQKIFTVDSRLVLKCIGHVASADRKEIIKQLKQHLCLESISQA